MAIHRQCTRLFYCLGIWLRTLALKGYKAIPIAFKIWGCGMTTLLIKTSTMSPKMVLDLIERCACEWRGTFESSRVIILRTTMRKAPQIFICRALIFSGADGRHHNYIHQSTLIIISYMIYMHLLKIQCYIVQRRLRKPQEQCGVICGVIWRF